ncbi:FadR/GntR family transcriptional regulator [Paracoccus sp. (in: a-proteobacteria)]|uniref:FadR/GntR family transcriptional regulator n=1 Tax=Paracoccus sp. TaxID=267 RepID=UPI0026E0AF5D|nr:FCD domain-containing protein [Paracoccus sp. (in: a-proteobacteria)]MDO5647658.1 FCD domain-containing protein [Paracoccus sp. (in: a-proteobacteria)]
MTNGSRIAVGQDDPDQATALAHLRDLLDAPGMRLPTERDLSAELGISRRAIRGALDVLESEGRVWRRQGAGTFTGPPPAPRGAPISAAPGNLLHVIEARITLEPTLARLAALRATPDQLRRIETGLAGLEQASDIDDADRWDSEIHREIARATGNPLLLALFDKINAWRHDDAIRQTRHRTRLRAGSALPGLRAVSEALHRHDAAAAARAMRDHLDDLMQNFLRHSHEETTGHDAD